MRACKPALKKIPSLLRFFLLVELKENMRTMRTPFTLMLFSLAFLLAGIPLSSLLPGNPGHYGKPQITGAGIPAAPGACLAEQTLNGGPGLAWATYYGGLDGDFGRAIATDSMGNVYLAGDTESEDIMNAGGHQNTYGACRRSI